MQVPEYKVVLIGPTNTGKTTFVNKLLGVQQPTTVTLGVEVNPLDLHHQGNKIRINFWDCAGNPSYKGLAEGYYINSKAALIFKDQHNEYITLERKLDQVCPGIPKLHIDSFNLQDDLLTIYRPKLYDLLLN